MPESQLLFISPDEIQALVRRMELLPQLYRRQQEEQVTCIVPVPVEWLDKARADFLKGRDLDDYLKKQGWSKEDLDLNLSRPEALRMYADARWGPSLEDTFLASKGSHDQVIYSILRVQEPGLARELWIRLEEQEATFAELASTFGEGPESAKKGLIGPIPVGNVIPASLIALIRSLRPGEVHPPLQVSDGKTDWNLLVRLESLTPARFDASMREYLLQRHLDKFFDERVKQLLAGEDVEEIYYDTN